ncbi:hypothetical protein PTKIN_Ptkin16aG0093200 [Pterospermum kingtungense]
MVRRIPIGFGNLINLKQLWLGENKLSCSIPLVIGRLQKLQLFTVEENSLSGAIPSSLENLTKLIKFSLSENNLQGRGSFGLAFKGVLEDGTIIAIKVLKLLSHRAFRSFLAECGVSRNVRHRNLVKISTACFGVDYNGNDFKALVYEFMANGSL